MLKFWQEVSVRALSARELAAAGDANDVAAEAQNDEDEDHIPDIADPDTAPRTFNVPMTPTTTEHPEPWYKTPEEANRAAREMGAYYRGETAPEEEDFVPPHEEKARSSGWCLVKTSNIQREREQEDQKDYF
jgi:hypothetical protein